MNKLDFYTIDTEYLEHLKKVDSSVPDYSYDSNDKFFCGIVTEINGFQYFAPISSFNRHQKTNLLIRDTNNKSIASIRFCFMVPAPPSVLTMKDFSLESDEKYAGLLSTELTFCRHNESSIESSAIRVYQYGISPEHPQYRNCCKFLELEKASEEYLAKKLS